MCVDVHERESAYVCVVYVCVCVCELVCVWTCEYANDKYVADIALFLNESRYLCTTFVKYDSNVLSSQVRETQLQIFVVV